MQIIIPMSGFGERFRRVGYRVPKPLIEIEGKPIIEHVVDMFPGESNFIFICNQDHLDNPDYRMMEILNAICPTGRVVGIAPHKLGPVHAVLQVRDLLDVSEPAVVNYCDFTCYWDWSHFCRFVRESGCDGAIPAYRGFHPHSLGTTNYAYMRETNGWVEAIQEKQPYTDDRMSEYASSGTYYYATGELMLSAFEETVAQSLQVGGEYYASLSYRPMLDRNRRIAVYPLQHFMQWGTPEDVAEYNAWSSVFRSLIEARPDVSRAGGAAVIPMAGLGQRFADAGYTTAKPMIPVSGAPMVVQAVEDLPAAESHVFVLRSDMQDQQAISDELENRWPGSLIRLIDEVTEGQACTADLGLEVLRKEVSPITIGACDNGALYDAVRLNLLLEDPEVDVIVWGKRGHVNAVRSPEMYGWIDADAEGVLRSVSVKQPLADPETDPVVLGTFTFRRAADYRAAVASLMARNGRVNGEFYIDSCINDAISMGLNCRLFEVEHYLCWGTPNELRTFNYWQSCFHKWKGHPYQLDLDERVPETSLAVIEKACDAIVPDLPG